MGVRINFKKAGIRFTSNTVKSVAENAVLLHTVTTNIAGDYSITGGADAALFEFTGSVTGVSTATLRWLANTTRNYESPADADVSNTYIVQLSATAAGKTATQTVTVTVTDVQESGPTITSSATASVAESAVLAHALTANQSVTWTLTGGADQSKFEIVNATLRWLLNTVRDFESPVDSNLDNAYVAQVTATNAALFATNQTVTVTVTNVDDTAPTITSAASANVAENAALSFALTANESVTWSIVGGADSALFEINGGSTLRFASNVTRNFESPADSNLDNIYVVQVRATDTATPANVTNQTISITVTDVVESGGTAANISFLDVHTTGTIASGSNQLTVASTTGFAVGQEIIVEVGGEAGGGLRNSVGVGGVWPKQTDDVRQYYQNTDNPKALLATILSINQTTKVLGLSVAASTTATNADVHVDNDSIWDAFFVSNPGNSVTMTMANGRFAFGKGEIPVFQRTGWTIQGQGKNATEIFAPRGCYGLQIGCFQSHSTTVKALHLRSNFRFNGFAAGSNEQEPHGVLFTICDNSVARDLRITDVSSGAVSTRSCTNTWAYDCDAVLTDGLQRYIQWMFNWSDGTGGGIERCTVTSPILTAGFECFRHDGWTATDCTGVNAVVSSNSSGNFTWDSFNLSFTALSQYSTLSFGTATPIMSINSNIQPPNAAMILGGNVIDAVITQAGYINATNDTLKGMDIGSNNPNVTVTGGTYTAPDYLVGGTTLGPLGIKSDGQNTQVANFTVVGTNNPGIANIYILHGHAANCTAGQITVVTEYP